MKLALSGNVIKSDDIRFFNLSAGILVKRFLAVFLLAGGLLVAGGAKAVPVTWTIPSTTFTTYRGTVVTSGSIAGTFVWDADTQTASSVNVTVNINGTTTVINSAAANYIPTPLIVFTNSVSPGSATNPPKLRI